MRRALVLGLVGALALGSIVSARPLVALFYQTIESGGTAQSQRGKLNFVNATITDDSTNDRTTVTIPSVSATPTFTSITATAATNFTLTGAAASTVTGTGKALTFTAGAGGATSGAGGNANLIGGAATNGNSTGGSAVLLGGAGHGNHTGGPAYLQAGAGGALAAGGSVFLIGGAGGATSGSGGGVDIDGGPATGTDQAGGGVYVNGGTKNGAGETGDVWLANITGDVYLGHAGADVEVTGELQVTGAWSTEAVTYKTVADSPVTVGATDYTVILDTSSGDISATLPTGATHGRRIEISVSNSGGSARTATITMAGGGSTLVCRGGAGPTASCAVRVPPMSATNVSFVSLSGLSPNLWSAAVTANTPTETSAATSASPAWECGGGAGDTAVNATLTAATSPTISDGGDTIKRCTILITQSGSNYAVTWPAGVVNGPATTGTANSKRQIVDLIWLPTEGKWHYLGGQGNY